ncbi:MAG: MobC family plasmid mobilization relaxosome protein [Gemmatimonadetes bacterium]|nr:MobC family plasmid mobilization relaxosome protein [Gemmatimonadota bacterium]MYI64925.1 MobC family plasmid mobilization relaxosome protein [Gemmatimonadota bacterium]
MPVDWPGPHPRPWRPPRSSASEPAHLGNNLNQIARWANTQFLSAGRHHAGRLVGRGCSGVISTRTTL